jgi:hypothetical protein
MELDETLVKQKEINNLERGDKLNDQSRVLPKEPEQPCGKTKNAPNDLPDSSMTFYDTRGSADWTKKYQCMLLSMREGGKGVL